MRKFIADSRKLSDKVQLQLIVENMTRTPRKLKKEIKSMGKKVSKESLGRFLANILDSKEN